ncbi:MAG: chemotaxis protein CheB [Myxococcales bacterium]|nr:chemotaxis protein CheB [Myxococcales bacterium]
MLLVDSPGDLPGLATPLFSEGDLVAAGAPCALGELLEAVRRCSPDAVLLELTPGPAVLAAIETLMAERPTPVLALRPPGVRAEVLFRALEAGAVDVKERPHRPTAAFWREIAHALLLISTVRVVRHVLGSRKRAASAGPPRAEDRLQRPPFPMVAIAASLGGPKALASLLGMLPRRFPAPLAVCQHISSGFTSGLAQWLAQQTSRQVVEARDGQLLSPGTVYLAPTDAHLLVLPDAKARLDDGPPLLGFKPSCDALLSSVARSFHRRAIGVVLTGMGRDGARGLREIRERGGRTIAQDESSSVVFGMPREAIELGAAERVLALEDIASALSQLVSEC